MGAANDLIVLFLGLETMSLAFYVLAASNRRRTKSQESGMKYFILGGFSSAFFLYGVALVYGSTGSTNLTEIVDGVRQHDPGRPQRGAAPRRHRPAPRRPRLQGRRRAVPRVDARRLRGGADAGHGADGVGRQGGGVRRDAAGSRRRPRSLPRRLAAGRVGAGRGVAGDRPGARHRADRRQAHARLLVDQPRRVHARRPRGRRPQRRRGRQRSRRAGRDGVPDGLRRARRRHVRRRRRSSPGAATRAPTSTRSAASASATLALAAGADGAARRPGRRAVHERVHRQVRGDRRRRRREQLRPGDHRHAVDGDRRLPLPADHGQRLDPGRPRRRRHVEP